MNRFQRLLTVVAITAAAASPAFADTVDLMMAKGYVMPITANIETHFRLDGEGKFIMVNPAEPGRAQTGVWRKAAPDELCTKVGDNPESCMKVPADVKPGQTFKAADSAKGYKFDLIIPK